jgi:3-oxoacyl-ACP reductase-like protein
VSIFGSIMSKIFSHAEAAGGGTSSPTQASADASPAATETASTQSAAAPSPPSQQAPSQPVDVEAVLTAMASEKGGGGNWQTSIVDLLKLLGLDSSLNARKELGSELNVHAGADGSAEQNIALHKAVMQKLAENGGKVPESLKS